MLKNVQKGLLVWFFFCLPFPFLASAAPKIFEAMLLRTLRGVDGALPPKMSLVPPPGGRSTLQINKKRNRKFR